MGQHADGKRHTVVLIDDDATIRTVVRILLQAGTSLEVVGEAADGRSGVALVVGKRPEAVVIDGQMPHLDGWQAGEMIRDLHPHVVMLLFTGDIPSALAARPFDAVHSKSEGAEVMIEDLVARIGAAAARVQGTGSQERGGGEEDLDDASFGAFRATALPPAGV